MNMESVIIFSEVSEKEMAYKPQNYASAILSDGKKSYLVWIKYKHVNANTKYK
jgi:hypothetical protein